MKAKDIVLCGMAVAMIEVAKLALSGIANVELVSLLILLFTLFFEKKIGYIIYTFVFVEGLIYGFGVWWIMYLYVWSILAFVAWFFRKNESTIFWAIITGIFGLLFGALCSIPYFFIGGIKMGISYWVAGVYFDIVHGISNFILTLCLFKPLYLFLKRIKSTIE